MASGLIAAWIFNERGLPPKEYVWNLSSTFSGTPTVTTRPPNDVGLSFASSAYVAVPASANIDVASNSISIVAAVKTTTGSRALIVGGYNASSPFNGYGIGINVVSSNFVDYWDGSGGGWNSGSTVINDGVWHSIAVVQVASGVGTGFFYVDGRLDTTNNQGDRAAFTGARALAATADGSSPFTGSIAYVYVYARGLSSGEVMQIHRAPYAMFVQPLRRAIKIPAVAADVPMGQAVFASWN